LKPSSPARGSVSRREESPSGPSLRPDDSTWYNEVSFWASKEARTDWHMNIYDKNAKEWAARSGAIMEDIITNFELAGTHPLRICPCCGTGQINHSI
jgi:hypothetical protein